MIQDFHELRVITTARRVLATECAAVRTVLGEQFAKTDAEISRIALRRLELRQRAGPIKK